MTSSRLVSSSTVVALALIGCDDNNGSTKGPALVEGRIAAAYCKVLDTCYAADTLENVFVLLAREASDAQCQAFVKRAVLSRFQLDANITSGKYTVDETKLTACLDKLVSSCGLDVFDNCADAINGTVASGGACTHDEECAADGYCHSGSCGGVCEARKARGESCEGGNDCSSAAGPSACGLDGHCVALEFATGAMKDADCGEIDADDKVTYTTCGAGLLCTDVEGVGTEKCVAPAAANEACTGDHSPCALGNVCVRTSGDSETGTCKELAVAKAGESCVDDLDPSGAGKLCNPVDFLGCLDGTCQSWGDGSVGSRCFALDVGGRCQAGNYCNGDTHQCAALKGLGTPCADDDECASEYCNSSGTGSAQCASFAQCTP